MAAEEGIFGNLLEEAALGFKEFSSKFEAIARQEDTAAMVRMIRAIPADDGGKKAALSAYFQTEEGSRATREERFQAYNDLLGVDRNERRRG